MIKFTQYRQGFSHFVAGILFLLLPVAMLSMVLLKNNLHYIQVTTHSYWLYTAYLCVGMLSSYILFAFRFRFLPISILLFFTLAWLEYLVDSLSDAEFDAFYLSVHYISFVVLLGIGWLIGWMFQRVRFAAIICSVFFLIIHIMLLSKEKLFSVEDLLRQFIPLVLFSVYIIFTAEALRASMQRGWKFWLRFLGRLLAFVFMMFWISSGIIMLLYPKLEAKMNESNSTTAQGENQQLKQNQDGSVNNQDQMGLSGNNRRNNNPEPLFCAHIDHTFSGTDYPNPLYLTSFHFTKFDTLTETFERDTSSLFCEEYVPDPVSIPLFFTSVDSIALKREKAIKAKKVVETEIYKTRLSAHAFIAPSTGFFVQPITVEKDFQHQFKFAYRAKSYVSELNSAYFIYNSDDPQVKLFQETRYAILRKAKPSSVLDADFLQYYTYFPLQGQYRGVKRLADSLCNDQATTIDKVLAVKNYFLQKDTKGKQVYQYADNPGIPGLPAASKLLYFLFENKKGYCAYYAAATVALLRAVGVPSRIVTGFMTVDRSDKNKGWYWYYEDQAHAWVQVYFPEYGWIDFDTTVGNEDAQESPAPDGTPPMQPPKPVIALSGRVLAVDTSNGIVKLWSENVIFKDTEFKNVNDSFQIDARQANVWIDTAKSSLAYLNDTMYVMMVSYSEKLNISMGDKKLESLRKKWPSPIPVDDIFFKTTNKKYQNNQPSQIKKSWSFKQIFLLSIVITLLIGLLLLLLPFLHLKYYERKTIRAKTPELKTQHAMKLVHFLVYLFHIQRADYTLKGMAKFKVDQVYGTNMGKLVDLYFKVQYAQQPLTEQEAIFINEFYNKFKKQLLAKFTTNHRIKAFINLNHYFNYYQTLGIHSK